MPMGDRSNSISGASTGRALPTTPRNFRNLDVNIKKVAVTMLDPNQPAQLIEFDQRVSLENNIADICSKWTLKDPESFALRFNEPHMKLYITENNRKDVKDGDVLVLAPSANKTAKDLIFAIHGNRLEDKNAALRHLSLLASDVTFADEFIKADGLQLVIEAVTSGAYKGDSLAYTLKSFVCLMEHGLTAWNDLTVEFIKRVADCISSPSSKSDTSCLQSALAILESVVINWCPLTHSTNAQSVVDQIVTPVNVIPHLESSDSLVQKNAIALINALFAQASNDRVKRKKIAENLQSKSMRNTIMTSVITGASVGAGMSHELYVLQTLLLNLNEERMKTPVDINDQAILREIEELRRIAFDIDGDPNINTVRKSQNSVKDYKSLGFEFQHKVLEKNNQFGILLILYPSKNDRSPAEDFLMAPPGILALDVMLYFARNHGQNYVKVVLENSSRTDGHDCPFVQASKMLTKILCEVLSIGEPPSDDGQTFYSMFFTHDKPFEEFFCICIQLLNKTWREMKATAQDFRKVLDVVKEQILRTLDGQPSSFESFRSKINSLTYAEINKLWESERVKKEGQGAHLKPIIQLREKITPDIKEIIKQQRLNYLMSGTRFSKYKATGRIKDKFWFWRLSPNQKALLYADCGESGAHPALEELTQKLSLSTIEKLQIGKDCPHVKDKGRGTKTQSQHAFCFKAEPDEPFCFVASGDNEKDMWIDGLNSLLGNDMNSVQVTKDLDTLLTMEIKMKMLETEGVPIPSEAPIIPPPPVNFNFAYQL